MTAVGRFPLALPTLDWLVMGTPRHIEPSSNFNLKVQVWRYSKKNLAHKRMGTALLKLTKTQKLGGCGRERLTKDKAIRLQHYYRYAIPADAGRDIDSMWNRIWATLFHCMSTDEEPHHTRCPQGVDSWCFHQQVLATDDDLPSHLEHVLDHDVAEAMVPVYKHMSSPGPEMVHFQFAYFL